MIVNMPRVHLRGPIVAAPWADKDWRARTIRPVVDVEPTDVPRETSDPEDDE